MRKVRWGVMSTAKIAREKVIPAMQRGAYCDVRAIASRSPDRAREVARHLGIPRAFGSYEALLADADIEAVYIPLPNHLHVDWSIRALASGKHVLCEKPLGVNAADAQELLVAAGEYPHLKVMEGFMYRHHPQWQRAKLLVDRGKIGELRAIQSFFAYYNVAPDNIRNRADAGGGGLMDIGCYPVSLARYLFEAEPLRVCGVMELDPVFKTDRQVSGIMVFGAGTATFTCGTQLAPYQRVNILGTDGRIEIEIPFNAPPDRPCRMWFQSGSQVEEIQLEVCDQYTIQGDIFAKAIVDDATVPTPLTDAVANMQVIDALVMSAKSGSWVSV
ncbi:MAG: Gfo/Idh/MocA family oxidoreductase [Desulfobacterales bacterium]|nr:Gfo/Idh/MocA family oxidoreductase [Desulfobacterales bacterium]MDJ0883326.1 Gfo/Idh/MocA family oxidoreductase [Desulfobacterales bacterium]